MAQVEQSPTGNTRMVLVRNDEASRFEGHIGDERVGLIEFRLRDGVMTITHTETDPQWGGRGVAAQMTRLALDSVRSDGVRVVPSCPYAAHFIATHEEYRDLLA